MKVPIFPVLLVLDGSDELIYLGSQKAWEREVEALRLLPEDRVIDSAGALFIPSGEGAALDAAGGNMPLSELAMLVQRHLFARSLTCITKVGLDSIAEAMEIMRRDSLDR